MKLEDTGQDSIELGFEIPEPGISVCKFEEGIVKLTNENSGKTTLRLPLIIDQVVDGPEDNVGKKLSHFVPIETAFGEKQLAGILSMVGLMDKFAKQFGGEVSAMDERFISGVKLKLPDNFVQVTHNVRKDNKGRDQTNIVKIEKAGKTVPAAAVEAKPGESASAESKDW